MSAKTILARGEWGAAASGRPFLVRNPANGEVVGKASEPTRSAAARPDFVATVSVWGCRDFDV